MLNEATLLLIEDEWNVGATLSERLKKHGFIVTWVQSFGDAKQALKDLSNPFDLSLVDIGLPDGNGFEVAKLIKHQYPKTALIFLSALSHVENRVQGLELGAEDFVPKPFHFKELLLRIQNALKRVQGRSELKTMQETPIGEAIIYFDRFEAKRGAETIKLSAKECTLLKLLISRPNQVISRDEILNAVWGEEEFPTPRTIDNFMVRMRKILEKNPNAPTVIKSIRGVGYQLRLS